MGGKSQVTLWGSNHSLLDRSCKSDRAPLQKEITWLRGSLKAWRKNDAVEDEKQELYEKKLLLVAYAMVMWLRKHNSSTNVCCKRQSLGTRLRCHSMAALAWMCYSLFQQVASSPAAKMV